MLNTVGLLFLCLFSLLSVASEKPKPGPVAADLIANSAASDWRVPDPAHLLYVELPGGRAVIELLPEIAPKHVENIGLLAREGYWNGLAVTRVQDNYVAQWGDPAEKPEDRRKFKTAKEKIDEHELEVGVDRSIRFTPLKEKDAYAAETGFIQGFWAAQDKREGKTWLVHCYGALGVGRDMAPNSGNGSELYVVIGHAPRHLDRNVTVLGRVIDGMEHFSSLPRGHGKLGFYEKSSEHVKIKSIRLGSEVPEKERASLEILRTDTPLFQQWIKARRTRKEEWFRHKAGHVEICNVPIPVRPRSN